MTGPVADSHGIPNRPLEQPLGPAAEDDPEPREEDPEHGSEEGFLEALDPSRLARQVAWALAILLVLALLWIGGELHYRIPPEPLMILVAAPLVARLADLRRGVTRAAEGST
jgi:hypothetical protein